MYHASDIHDVPFAGESEMESSKTSKRGIAFLSVAAAAMITLAAFAVIMTADADDGDEGALGASINISSYTDLMKIGNVSGYPLSGSYILTNDITFGTTENASFVPIGRSSAGDEFTGTFDGQGFTISGVNLTITVPDGGGVYAGIFGYVGPGGEIKNLNVRGSITASSGSGKEAHAGGIAGHMVANNMTNSSITGCSFIGSVKAEAVDEYAFAGGIVGYQSDYAEITCCYSNGTIWAVSEDNLAHAGGIAGKSLYDTTVKDCYSTSVITATSVSSGGTAYAGGIVGFSTNIVTVERCYSVGTIKASASGSTFAGGIVGYGWSGFGGSSDKIKYCFFLEGIVNNDVICGNGMPAVTGGGVKTSEQMRDLYEFVSWDTFDAIVNPEGLWMIVPSKNSGYPILRGLADAIPVESVTVSFYNGSAALTPQTVLRGDPVTAPAGVSAPAGKKLDGWYTADGTGGAWGTKWVFTKAVNDNMDLYAKWVDDNVTVNFYDGTTALTPQTVIRGDPVTAPTGVSVPVGKMLGGWYTKDGTDGDWGSRWTFTAAVTADMDLYAKWVEDGVTVQFISEGVSVDDVTVTRGDPVTAPIGVPAPAGKKLDGWYTADGTDGDWGSKWVFTTTVTDDMSLYAKWVDNDDTSAGAGNGGGGMNLMLLVAIAVAAVVAIGLAVYFFVIKKR